MPLSKYKCDEVICINGYCEIDGKFNEPKCICDYGWNGASCQWPYTDVWYPWGSWSVFLPSCGENRFRTRTRECIDETVKCVSKNETEKCSKQTCDTRSNDFFGWSEWSKCSEICGYGQQYQTKFCTSMEVKSNKCTNKDDLINTRTQQCFLKQSII